MARPLRKPPTSSPASKTTPPPSPKPSEIENGLHWRLDISFRGDHCRVRKDHAPKNLGILRHMAINMLKREKSLKGDMQTKRVKAA
jgi:hypothetical protein